MAPGTNVHRLWSDARPTRRVHIVTGGDQADTTEPEPDSCSSCRRLRAELVALRTRILAAVAVLGSGPEVPGSGPVRR